MSILGDLLHTLPDDVPVRSVMAGAHWTVVCSRYCGMAATLMDNHPHGRSFMWAHLTCCQLLKKKTRDAVSLH